MSNTDEPKPAAGKSPVTPALSDPVVGESTIASASSDPVVGGSTLTSASGHSVGGEPAGASTSPESAFSSGFAPRHEPHHQHGHDHTPHPVHENAPYAYSLISWGSVLAGAAIAVVIGVMLNILGLAFGLSTLQPGDPNAGEAFGAGAGLWLALSTLLGMLVGGYVAARSAHNPDHHEGILHGAAVWAVGFLLALFLTGSTVGGAAFSGIQAAGGAAEAATSQAAGQAADTARAAADAATPDTPVERERAEAAADAGGAAAFWAFITMLASGVAAVIGGTLGARHDEKLHRPRGSGSSASKVF